MQWKKLGLIFCASDLNQWMISGGRAPVPLYLGENKFRIYFGAYDKLGRGRIFSLEIDLLTPNKIYNLIKYPIIDIGEIGSFDDNGIIPSDIIRVNEKIYLYTIGFSIKNKVLFDAASGVAISYDNGQTYKKYKGPVIDRGIDDPCFATSPTVLYENGLWHMWYVSCDRWEPFGEGYKHYYNIKYRTSFDGIYWDPHAKICINYSNKYEYAISRPSIIKEANGLYRMWYSFRATSKIKNYRIGYAESNDGYNWIRMDNKVGIDVSDSGWDSEMICYPYVFDHKGTKYMLYNGNKYGASGFGLAVLERDQTVFL